MDFIYVPRELIPTNLIAWDELTPFTRLVQEVAHHLERGNLPEAENIAQRALGVARRARDPLNQAVALLCLSDVYRVMPNPELALRFALQAYQAFEKLPHRIQRHNQAISAYNLGLICSAMENQQEALNWYTTALRMLEEASEYWLYGKEMARVNQCKRLQAWIDSLIQNLLSDLTQPFQGPLMEIPVQSAEEPVIRTAQLRIGRPIERLSINGEILQFISLSGRPVIPDLQCRIFPVPPSAHQYLREKTREDGDYVLARPDAPTRRDAFYIVDEPTAFRFINQGDGEVISTVQKVQPEPAANPTSYRPLGLLRAI